MDVIIKHQTPSAAEFNHLRKLAGWPILDLHLVNEALSNTLFAVCAFAHDNSLIGMGRIVGDNAIYLHIQDVIVHPEFQRRGIGRLLMRDLVAYTDTVGGKYTNIGLMCSKGREDFYKSFGFTERPSPNLGAGMTKVKSE